MYRMMLQFTGYSYPLFQLYIFTSFGLVLWILRWKVYNTVNGQLLCRYVSKFQGEISHVIHICILTHNKRLSFILWVLFEYQFVSLLPNLTLSSVQIAFFTTLRFSWTPMSSFIALIFNVLDEYCNIPVYVAILLYLFMCKIYGCNWILSSNIIMERWPRCRSHDLIQPL